MHELRMFDVRVIAVVRDQVSWWQSFYNQQVLRSSERRPIAQVSLEEQADFYQRLSEWVPYVGKRNILWIEYNDPTSSSALLVSRFFAAIGVDVEERLEERLLNSNRSACAEVVAFSRWLNGYLSPLLIKKKAQWLSRYPAGVRFLESLFQFAPSFLRKRWITPVRLSKRRQEEIQRQYVQVNLKLRHEFSRK